MGVNSLAPLGDTDIASLVNDALMIEVPKSSSLYGGGLASERIAKRLSQEMF